MTDDQTTCPTCRRPICPTCKGCGQIASSDDREPWSYWEGLPPGSDLAVRLGLVYPLPCPDCSEVQP